MGGVCPPSMAPPSPNFLAPRLACALPLAERWDSFSEAAGCQERRSPRRSWVKCMWVTASQKEAFHPPPPHPPLPFCAFVPSRSFGFPPSLLTSRKLTLISVCPVFLGSGWAQTRNKAAVCWLIGSHTPPARLCSFLTRTKRNCRWEGWTKKESAADVSPSSLSLPSHQLSTSAFASLLGCFSFSDGCWVLCAVLVGARRPGTSLACMFDVHCSPVVPLYSCWFLC